MRLCFCLSFVITFHLIYLNLFQVWIFDIEMSREFPKVTWLFKRQSHKMVKHTHTIRRLWPTNFLIVFDHFVELGLKV